MGHAVGRNRPPSFVRPAARTPEVVTQEYNLVMTEAGHLRRQLESVIPARLKALDEQAERLEKEIKRIAPAAVSDDCPINEYCAFGAGHEGPCRDASGVDRKAISDVATSGALGNAVQGAALGRA